MISPLAMKLLCALALVNAAAHRNTASSKQRSLLRGIDGGAEQALRRVEAVEDFASSRVLCRVAGSDGMGSVTVRLQPASNTRSLSFNGDAVGVETRVRCEGSPDPQCLSSGADAGSREAQTPDECSSCPCAGNTGRLYGAYAVAVAAEIDGRCRAREAAGGPAVRVLLLGLGGGELATHVSRTCGSNAEVEGVELDGRLPALAKRYFGLPEGVQVTVGDAGARVAELKNQLQEQPLLADGRRYDVVLVDCFSDGGVTPPACRSADFVGGVQALLRGGGLALQHLWREDSNHPEVANEYGATVDLYRSAFACPGCRVEARPLKGPDSIVAAFAAQTNSSGTMDV